MQTSLGEEGLAILRPAMGPIKEERDFLLAHTMWHASFGMPPNSRAVAVLGAAHLPGVEREWRTFAARGCSARDCGCQDEVDRYSHAPKNKLVFAAGGLLAMSATSMGARWALVRHLRRKGGQAEVWARRFNRGSLALVGGAFIYGAFTAQSNYELVRALQHRAIRYHVDAVPCGL